MKYFLVAAAVVMATSPAWAVVAVSVPEMDASFGITAVAILGGVVAIVREKFLRK